MRSCWIRVALNPMNDVLRRDGSREHVQRREEKPCEDTSLGDTFHPTTVSIVIVFKITCLSPRRGPNLSHSPGSQASPGKESPCPSEFFLIHQLTEK